MVSLYNFIVLFCVLFSALVSCWIGSAVQRILNILEEKRK